MNVTGAIQLEYFDGQVSQHCSFFMAQNFPFRLDKPTGAASCSFSLANYKTSAHARRGGTGRAQKSSKKILGRLLFLAHPTHTLRAISSFCHFRMARGLRILYEANPIRIAERNSSNSRISSDTRQQSMTLSKEANTIGTVGQSASHQADSSVEHVTRRGFVLSAVALGAAAVSESAVWGADEKIEPVPIIDSHIHLFDGSRPQGAPYVGPGGDSPTISLPDDYRKLAVPLGITGAIKVEASPWVEDNLWALQVMQSDDMMLGLVGNLQPEKPDFPELLVRHAKNPLFRGIRHGNLWGYDLTKMVKDDAFMKGMRLLSDLNLSLDIANPTVPLLEAVVQLNDGVPDLRIIIDHLPGLEPTADTQAAYDNVLKVLHSRKNIFVKLSSVIHRIEGKIVKDLEVLRPRLDRLIDVFGDDRILFGSDWPNSDGVAPLDQVVGIVKEYFADKPRELQEKYFWKNSVTAYKWKVKRDR